MEGWRDGQLDVHGTGMQEGGYGEMDGRVSGRLDNRQMGQMDALWHGVSRRHEPPEPAVMQGLHPFVPSSGQWVCDGVVDPGDEDGDIRAPSSRTHRSAPTGDPPAPGVGRLSSNPRPELVPPSNPLLGPALLANHSRPRPATPTPRGNPALRGGAGTSPHQPGAAPSCSVLTGVDSETPSAPPIPRRGA